MCYEAQQFEKELPRSQEQSDVAREAEGRMRQAGDAPQYQQNADGSYQRHFMDRQGGEITLRVEGNDRRSIARVEGEESSMSQHGIRIRAADTVEAQSQPAFHGKGEMARANTTLEINRDGNGVESDRRLRLNDIETHSNYQGRGVGGEMLREAEQVGRQQNVREIYGNLSYEAGDEAKVRHFYRSHDYKFRQNPGGGEEVYKSLDRPATDAEALRREMRR